MKIAIVNQSPTIIEGFKYLLETVSDYKILWITSQGNEALFKYPINPPDLILIDVDIPDLRLAQLTSLLMNKANCSILITTNSIDENASEVFEAMGEGALDAIHIPELPYDIKAESTIKFLKKIEIFKVLLGKTESVNKITHVENTSVVPMQDLPQLILIGASTGGPVAILKILLALPRPFKGAMIIIQHVDQQFVSGMAKWLSERSSLNVKLAQNGDQPREGEILVAGTNHHLVMTKELKLKYTEDPKENLYRPSADVLFTSVAKNWPERSIAILLTGMGKDGAKGLKALYNAGWYTIAEHEDSCVVYGMPKAAIEIQAVKQVIILEKIASEIISFMRNKLLANPWRKP